MRWRVLSILQVSLWLAACPARDQQPAGPDLPAHQPDQGQVAGPDRAARLEPLRIIAVGDLHGDLARTREALRLAGAIDGQDRWVGGRLVLVQTGDHLDRGDADRKVFDLLESLRGQAEKAGGQLLVLLGNHEAMNVELDFRYVTAAALAEFSDLPYSADDPLLSTLPEAQRGRAAAFRPGGPYARLLARHQTILVLGETVFVHGGVLPSHLELGVDQINLALAAWLRGEGSAPTALLGESGPLWDRTYAADATAEDCALLAKALAKLSARRMVVGHQPYPSGISSACNDQLWRIDTGMSAHYGGVVQVLEIVEGQTRIIRP